MKKVSASLPAAQFEAVERLRRKLKLKRSRVVQEALSLWLTTHADGERSDQYLKGYLQHPEYAAEAHAFVRAWAAGQEPEDWA